MNLRKKPDLISLVGYAGSGKDTVATTLKADGYKQVAFADPVREMAAAINPWVRLDTCHFVRYNDLIEEMGYDKAKRTYPEVRALLQRIGTEAGRGVISDAVWIDVAEQRIEKLRAEGHRVVTTDCRFDNEVDLSRRLGGRVVLVNRPGCGPANDHDSETLPGRVVPDEVIDNDGSLLDLFAKSMDLMEEARPKSRHRIVGILIGIAITLALMLAGCGSSRPAVEKRSAVVAAMPDTIVRARPYQIPEGTLSQPLHVVRYRDTSQARGPEFVSLKATPDTLFLRTRSKGVEIEHAIVTPARGEQVHVPAGSGKVQRPLVTGEPERGEPPEEEQKGWVSSAVEKAVRHWLLIITCGLAGIALALIVRSTGILRRR